MKFKNNIIKSLIAFFSSVLLILTTSCTYVRTVTDYPDPSVGLSQASDGGDIEKDEDKVEVKTEEGDSIRKYGAYAYNPTKVHPSVKKQFEKSPELIKLAEYIMQCIYDRKETIEFTGEYEAKDENIDTAFKIAEASTPLCGCVTIGKIDEASTTYQVVYFPMYLAAEDDTAEEFHNDMAYVNERFDKFEEFVTELINDNINPETSDIDRAKIIYEALITNTEFSHEFGYDFTNYEVRYTVECAYDGQFSVFELEEMYMFFMIQLDIEALPLASVGTYQEQSYTYVDEIMDSVKDTGWIWTIITIGENSFHCDIVFDKLAYDSIKEQTGATDYESKYFGMSDEKRKESYMIRYEVIYLRILPGKTFSIPKCEKNYNEL